MMTAPTNNPVINESVIVSIVALIKIVPINAINAKKLKDMCSRLLLPENNIKQIFCN